MDRMIYIACLPVLIAGVLVGYGISPSSSVVAQEGATFEEVHPLGDPGVMCPEVEGPCADQSADPFRNRVTGEHQPMAWRTTIPAPLPTRRKGAVRPQQQLESLYWAIEDIRNTHQVLADAEQAGTLDQVDPNAALHDFPFWTPSLLMVIEHTPENGAGNMAEQSMGVGQLVVFMGGTGTVVAGGEIPDAVTLSEEGQPIWGELRGSSIQGGETFQVKQGDFLTIPPNTPAQFTANSTGGLTYMTMKVNAQMYPWELIR